MLLKQELFMRKFPLETHPLNFVSKCGSCESATLNTPENLENSKVATGLEKINFHSSPKEGQCQRMLKLHNSLLSHASKVMPQILQARLQKYVNRELSDVQLDLEKAEEPETKLPTSTGS